MLLGELRYPDAPGTPRAFPDLRGRELAAAILSLVLGVATGIVLPLLNAPT